MLDPGLSSRYKAPCNCTKLHTTRYTLVTYCSWC